MLQAGRFNRGHMMKKIKMYNTSLTTMDAELFKKIKILAEKFNKDQNELLEEAAQDLIKKYEHKISSPNVKSLPNVNSDDSSKIEMIG
jgi:translation initiation factor 2 alpha subunit (eIF-2alpha)